MQSIELVATDMDLTLLADDKSMPEGTGRRIDALARRGILFCAASGRPVPALRESFPRHHGDMALIADNGASVYLRGEAIFLDAIDRALYHEVLSLSARREDGVPVLCAYDEAYMLERDRRHADTVGIYYRSITCVESFDALGVEANKVSTISELGQQAQPRYGIWTAIRQPALRHLQSGDEWLDFMNVGVDKGTGIRRLAEHLHIGLENVAAFGDTYNDIPMLDIVGHGYVMANAAEHMREHGDYLARATTTPGCSPSSTGSSPPSTEPEPLAPRQPGPRRSTRNAARARRGARSRAGRGIISPRPTSRRKTPRR